MPAAAPCPEAPGPLPGASVTGDAAAVGDASAAASLKRLLKLETERLRMRQALGLGGTEIAAARADLMDHVVRRACQDAAQAAGPEAQRELAHCAVVALGGYGRRELSPCSDVDLLFLHRGSASKAVAAFVEKTLMTLWDAGLTLGHSFRSARECAAEARTDLHSRTALTQARLVVGSQLQFDMLRQRLDIALGAGSASQQAFLAQMREEWRERETRFGAAVCVLEPQVKEGPGGLRDVHAVLWIAHARYGARGLSGLESASILEPADYAAVRRAYDFLLRVRNEAHFATGRKTDLLTLDLQAELAARLGYRDRGGLLASELLMRDYYRRASRIHEVCSAFVEAELLAPPRRGLFAALRLPRAKGTGSLELKHGRLRLRSGAALRSGSAVLEVFERAQLEGVPLAHELRRTLREKAELVGGRFRKSRDAGAALLRLAAHRGRVGATLRELHDTGVLGRLVPEWARITFLVQHDFFHKYTVDEHTLRAIDALDELVAGQHPEEVRLARLFDELQDSRALYLGMLLHDIAKGRGGGHVQKGVGLARRILKDLAVEAEVADKVVFLVGAHLDMSQISQRRDLSEPAPVEAFATRVGSLERLNLLMLLTYADHCGVGPGTWNEWKASLLWELYDRTRRELEIHPGSGRPEPSRVAHDAAVAYLLHDFEAAEIERHFSLLPERYLRSADAARLVSDFRLVRSRGESPAAFEWADRGDGRGTELTVTARDRTGLFALLAGTLAVRGIDILGADLFTRNDGVVLDTLRVAEVPGQRPLRPERRVRIEAALLDAVDGRLDVAEAFDKWRAQNPVRSRRAGGRAARAPVVRFDQEASALATVVEVKAQDQPGLGYTLAHTLAELGLDITFARIATAKALALDVFYVRDRQARKLDPDSLPAVERALLEALGARDEGRSGQ
jgi:[protein-PII] uridylyltransferase